MSILLLTLVFSSVQAGELGAELYPDLMEFDQAFALHNAGEFERARAGFRHLAELGDPQARLNLGVMLLRGEGGPADRAAGVAWVRWAADDVAELAEPVLEIIEPLLTDAEQATAAEKLGELRARFDSAATLASAETMRAAAGGRYGCLCERIHKVPPAYPNDALQRGQIGAAYLEFIVAPDGTIGGVHVLRGVDRRDPFRDAALRAGFRWHANACPGESFGTFFQSITFEIGEVERVTPFSPAERQRMAGLVAAARAGEPASAYQAALLADHFPGLLDLVPGERESLLLGAAVAGLPEARYRLAIALAGVAESSLPRRWRLLAARQGHPPALFRVAQDRRLPVAEREAALLRAAEAGYEPAIFLAARLFSAHPVESHRDGALALALTDSLNRVQLRDDMLLAQARAMALAETGKHREAARLQQRVVRALAGSGRATAEAAARLAVYEAGEAWRDPLLLEEFVPAEVN